MTRNDWKNLPIPASNATFQLDKALTPEEYQQVCLGHKPYAMEDKWFAFVEGDYLYFHRSWTGYCIYQVRIEDLNGEYLLTETVVNRDPEQYTEGNLDHDKSRLNRMIDSILLQKPFR